MNISDTTIPIDTLKKYALFRKLKAKEGIFVLSTAKIAYIASDKCAIIVNTEDQFFHVGEPSNDGSICFRINPTLCNKRVKEVICGWNGNWFALTENGSLYTWTDSSSFSSSTIPTLVRGKLEGRKVIQIAVAGPQFLALTDHGDVFVGNNPPGILAAMIYQSAFQTERIISITSFFTGISYTSVALSWQGRVFCWDQSSQIPHTIPIVSGILPDQQCFAKINGRFAISKDGSLQQINIVNYPGHVGHECYSMMGINFGISSTSTIADMGVQHTTALQCVQTTDGKVYVQKTLHDQSVGPSMIKKQMEPSKHATLNDAFAECTGWQMSCGTIVSASNFDFQWFNDNQTSTDNERQNFESRQFFNHKQTSDVVFIVEGKTIYGHSSVLQKRWDSFPNAFKDSIDKTIMLDSGVTYMSFQALIYHCYTDHIEIPETDSKSYMDLLQLANQYGDRKLERKCIAVLVWFLHMNNVLPLFRKAVALNSKILERACLNFIAENKLQVSNSTTPENIEALGSQAQSKLITALLRQ